MNTNEEDTYDDEHTLTFEGAEAEAKTEGLVVRLPKDNELFIDIDSEEAWTRFLIQRAKLFGGDGEVVTHVSLSKSGGSHRHVVVDLQRKVTHLERIALQTLLGSDLTRETLSYKRLLAGNPHPTLFFEKAA